MQNLDGLRPTQREVYDAVERFGPIPDHALVPLAQHVSRVHQSSSGIRTRRAELTDAGLVKSVAQVKMPSGRTAHVWSVA